MAVAPSLLSGGRVQLPAHDCDLALVAAAVTTSASARLPGLLIRVFCELDIDHPAIVLELHVWACRVAVTLTSSSPWAARAVDLDVRIDEGFHRLGSNGRRLVRIQSTVVRVRTPPQRARAQKVGEEARHERL